MLIDMHGNFWYPFNGNIYKVIQQISFTEKMDLHYIKLIKPKEGNINSFKFVVEEDLC